MEKAMQGQARWVRVAAAVLLCSALSWMVLFTPTQPAYAAESGALAVKVQQRLEYPAGESGLRQTWEYRLERATAEAPLPEGAQGDAYSWSMTGDDTTSVSLVAPESAGDYWYRMHQVVPKGLDAAYAPDDTVYDVRIHVDAEGAASLLVYEGGVKKADPGWTVFYQPPAPAPQKPSGIIGAIASALPKTGDMSYLIMGAAVLIAVVGTCSIAAGRALSGQRAESAAGKGMNDDEQ